MRVTLLTQFIGGAAHRDETRSAERLKALQRIKWLLWHVNVQSALAVNRIAP